MAAVLTVPVPSGNKTVNQHTRISVPPSEPLPQLLATPSSVSKNPIALRLPNANHSLFLPENLTAHSHFDIPDSPIELELEEPLGRILSFDSVLETIGRAIEEIADGVHLHPAEPITNGRFRQGKDGVDVSVYQYVDKQITWSLLSQLLVGLMYLQAGVLQPSREVRFEIRVRHIQGSVGYGSLWHNGPPGEHDVAKRAVNDTAQQLPIISVASKPAPTDPDHHSSLLPLPKEDDIVFSYHFFGPAIPESLLELCFRRARQSIRTNVQRHPQYEIPGGLFQYRVDGSPVSIAIKAAAGKRISWLLLDDILRDLGRHIIGGHRLLPCDFEFEIYPYEEPQGYGALTYDAAAILPATPSRIAASAVKRTSHGESVVGV